MTLVKQSQHLPKQYQKCYYHEEVWHYHKSMVEAIRSGNFEEGYKAMAIHMDLINLRYNQIGSKQKFE